MPYTPNEQVEKFFTQKIFPVLTNITQCKSRFPEINKAYKENVELTIQNFGVMFSFSCSDKLSPDTAEGCHLAFGCQLESGAPKVCIFVPALMKIHEEIQRSKSRNWYEKFELVLTVGFLHELDHCAIKEVTEKNGTPDELIRSETKVWARTCEQTLRPLIEVHSARIPESHERYYKAWVRGGRMTDGREWKEYITKVYSKLKRG